MFRIGLKTMTAWVRLDINMKKIVAFLLMLSCLFCCGCGKKAEETKAGFIDKQTGIEYIYCEYNGLAPNAKGQEYARSKVRSYYKVPNENEKKFLCTEEGGELILLRAKDVEEPTLENFDAIGASVYDANNIVKITAFYVDEEYRDNKPTGDYKGESSVCKSITKAFRDNEDVGVPANTDESETYNIHLLSKDYPGLHYNVVFTSSMGRYYLIDRATQKAVYAPDDVVARMVG